MYISQVENLVEEIENARVPGCADAVHLLFQKFGTKDNVIDDGVIVFVVLKVAILLFDDSILIQSGVLRSSRLVYNTSKEVGVAILKGVFVLS